MFPHLCRWVVAYPYGRDEGRDEGRHDVSSRVPDRRNHRQSILPLDYQDHEGDRIEDHNAAVAAKAGNLLAQVSYSSIHLSRLFYSFVPSPSPSPNSFAVLLPSYALDGP